MKPFVSVIIPTYHDWERLEMCLTALKAQTYPHDRFEVIVVNNDPDDPIPEMDFPPNYQIVSESKPGSYAARNKGLSVAKGEILAFTDSDCIPYEDWLEKAVERLERGAERLGGHIELFYRSKRLTFAEVYEKYYAFPQEEFVGQGASVTANMITWRKHFDTVGLFNEKTMSGGDMEWGWRAHDLGIPIVFAADVVVRHPARSTIKDLIKKRNRVLVGLGKIAPKDNRSEKHNLSGIVRGFMPPLFFFLKLRKNKDIPAYEKIALFWVLYLIKIHKTFLLIRSWTDSKNQEEG